MAKKEDGAPGIRDEAGRFRKGHSGNPKGRKRVPEQVRELLSAATPEAAALLVRTMEDPENDLKLRLDCAKELLNRVYGKAVQPVDGAVETQVTVKLPKEAEEFAG